MITCEINIHKKVMLNNINSEVKFFEEMSEKVMRISFNLKLIMTDEGMTQEDTEEVAEIDERVIKEVASSLRIIGDEINEEYRKFSLRNILFWIRIIGTFKRVWI